MAINRIIWGIYAKYHFFMYAHPSERVQVLSQTTAMKQTLKQVIQILWPPTVYRSYVGLRGGSCWLRGWLHAPSAGGLVRFLFRELDPTRHNLRVCMLQLKFPNAAAKKKFKDRTCQKWRPSTQPSKCLGSCLVYSVVCKRAIALCLKARCKYLNVKVLYCQTLLTTIWAFWEASCWWRVWPSRWRLLADQGAGSCWRLSCCGNFLR